MGERSFTERIEHQSSMPVMPTRAPRKDSQKLLFVIATVMGVISIALSILAITLVIAE